MYQDEFLQLLWTLSSDPINQSKALFGGALAHSKWRIPQFLSTTGSTNRGLRLWQVQFQMKNLKHSFSGLFLSLSKMNRFLLLTGIGPTVSRDDALTWIQVVFVIFVTNCTINVIITNFIITVNMIITSKKSLSAATLHGSPRCLEDGETLLWPDTW